MLEPLLPMARSGLKAEVLDGVVAEPGIFGAVAKPARQVFGRLGVQPISPKTISLKAPLQCCDLVLSRPDQPMPMHLNGKAVIDDMATDGKVRLQEVGNSAEATSNSATHPAEHPAQIMFCRPRRVGAEHPIVVNDRDRPNLPSGLTSSTAFVEDLRPPSSSRGIKGVEIARVSLVEDMLPLPQLLPKREILDSLRHELFLDSELEQF